MPRILIAFYSTYGTNHGIASHAAEAARAAGAEVRLVRFAETAPKEVVEGQEAWKNQLEKMQDIPVISHDDVLWADGIFFSVPTRYGNAPSQVQAFIDTLGPLWMEGKLMNKTISAAATAQNAQGGQTTTILGLYRATMHWSAIPVTPGYSSEVIFGAGGNPYGYAGTAGNFDEAGKAAVAHQLKRLVEVTASFREEGKALAA